MNLVFFFFNTFLNINYKNLFFKKIYFLGFEFFLSNKKRNEKFSFLFLFWKKKFFNFLNNKFLYKIFFYKKIYFFLSNNNLYSKKIIFIYFKKIKKIYIFFFNLIFYFLNLFFFIKKQIFFYKKIFLSFYNFKKNICLNISYFYSKVLLVNLSLLFNVFFNYFFINFFKLSFIVFCLKKIFYIFFNKKIFQRFIYVIIYNLNIFYIPSYILYTLSINKLSCTNIYKNVFVYFFLLFGINFYIFFDTNLFNFIFFIIDYIYFKKKILILKNNFLINSSIGFFIDYDFIRFFNYFDIFLFFFNENLIFKNFFLKFIYYDLIINWNFYNLFDITFFLKNNLNYFIFNKNIEYLLNILYRISNFFINSFIFDKIFDFPFKNYIYINIFKIYNFINLKLFQISNILNILNFNFIYYKYYYLVFVPYLRSDILTEEDLIDELYKFYNLKFIEKKKFFFLKSILKYLDYFYNLRKILINKNINELNSSIFIDFFNNLFFSLNKFPLKLLNPISNKISVLRSSLIFNLINNFNLNFNNLFSFYYIYEIGKIYYYNNNIFDNLSIRGIKELNKFTLLFWNLNFDICNLELIVSFFNDLFFLFKIEYIIISIFTNISFLNYYFIFVFNDRFLGYLGKLDNTNIKLNNFFIIDLNFLKKKNIIINNFFKKYFFKRDLSLIYNFKFSFINFLSLIKKFFIKNKIFYLLYNLYYISNYNFYKFVCVRLICFYNFNCYNYINYLIFKIFNYLNINHNLWII